MLKKQLSLFQEEAPEKTDTTSTFVDNMVLPVHRWFRYSAGFSAEWAREVMVEEKKSGRRRVLDPFAGSGTTLLEGEACGLESVGVEAHPFVARIAQAKLRWRANVKDFRNYSLAILEEGRKLETMTWGYPKLIEKCYTPESLVRLDALRRAWQAKADGSDVSELTWLALLSILRDCSPVGTAPWQYVLPNKSKAKVVDPYEAFQAKVHLMSGDMVGRQERVHGAAAVLHQGDARECSEVPDGWADLVITSPPYANNYDYADATRLEMTFFGHIRGWGELQSTIRRHLIRSCTQHVAKLNWQTQSLLSDPWLAPIQSGLTEACEQLANEKENHGGKKPYNTMIAAYFSDMARVWAALRRVTGRGALVCFVVGDSAPYGVYIPVDTWLGELAVAAGFKSYTFEKTRDRNVKWKNRKHRVPLQEGRLWVQG